VNLAAILVLAGGTYAFRVTGPLLRGRLRVSERVTRLLSVSASVLLVALVATATLTEGHSFAGWARPAGVLVGGVLAVRRAPFLVIVVAAIGTTAGLRLLGVH
jgi:branched-subunit amino acid transport protein